MRELTEQQKLARLVGGEGMDNEAFDSADMLTQGLLERMGGIDNRILAEVQGEIESRGERADFTPVARFSTNGPQPATPADPEEPKYDRRFVLTLKNIHEGLIDVFERSGIDSGVGEKLVALINKSSACIQYLGEQVEPFQPLSHLSGLQAPDMVKNANKVVETTLQCYKIGKIDDAQVSDDGRKIGIVFSGSEHGIMYKAFGSIAANSWEGSEAIDYIFVPKSGGKMSVKSFENGKWIDKSENGNYDIRWDLEETDLLAEEEVQVPENNAPIENNTITNVTADSVVNENVESPVESNVEKDVEKNVESNVVVEKNIPQKKEDQPELLNKENDDEEIGDFPISDGNSN